MAPVPGYPPVVSSTESVLSPSGCSGERIALVVGRSNNPHTTRTRKSPDKAGKDDPYLGTASCAVGGSHGTSVGLHDGGGNGESQARAPSRPRLVAPREALKGPGEKIGREARPFIKGMNLQIAIDSLGLEGDQSLPMPQGILHHVGKGLSHPQSVHFCLLIHICRCRRSPLCRSR